MFNKVTAPFSGTVVKSLIEGDGMIISKGQALFNVKPDEEFVIDDPGKAGGAATKVMPTYS